ncbi:MAG: hypothetical protein R3C11_19800 [Planctomycetaceae bacterium]
MSSSCRSSFKRRTTKQEMRLADLRAGNSSMSAREFQERQGSSLVEGVPGGGTGEEPPAGRQMKFDPNTGRFIEVSPPPRRTNSTWETLDEGPQSGGGPDKQKPRQPYQEKPDPSPAGNSMFANDSSPATQGKPGSEDGGPGGNELGKSSLLNLDKEPSQFADQGQPGANKSLNEFSDQSFGEMKPIREIDPRTTSNNPFASKGGASELEPSFTGTKNLNDGSPSSGQPGSSLSSEPATPWYQSENDNKTGAASGFNGSASMSNAPSMSSASSLSNGPAKPADGAEPFIKEINRPIRMQRELQVVIDGESIEMEGQKPIDVDLDRADAEIATEFKKQVAEIVSTWHQLPKGYVWSPNMKFVVLPGGNVSLERLLLQLPLRDLDYKTEFELDRPQPFSVEEPLLDESVEKILLLEGAK